MSAPHVPALVDRLRGWANQIAQRFGHPVYLVGSALEREDVRDIDVRVVLPLDEFVARYGFRDYQQNHWNDTGWPAARRRLAEDVGNLAAKGSLVLGLNLDLQVTSDVEAMARYDGKPRVRVDTVGVGHDSPSGPVSTRWLDRPPTAEEVRAHAEAHPVAGWHGGPWGRWLRFGEPGNPYLAVLGCEGEEPCEVGSMPLSRLHREGNRWRQLTASGYEVPLPKVVDVCIAILRERPWRGDGAEEEAADVVCDALEGKVRATSAPDGLPAP